MTSNQKRQAVCDIYRTILGRNRYSNSLRDYCFKKYKDGNYYSDCSSSVSYCYKEAGFSFGILNTVGMYQSKKLTQVPVVIKNGIIQNKEVLHLGDMLLFAGTDSDRAYAGYVGHVEMVYKIGSKITIAGHGSGTPSTKDMDTYCKSRYKQTSSTKLGHRGLIRVMRFIQDDGVTDPTPKLGDRTLKNGMEGADVKELQEALIGLGYSCGSYGADGEFGDCTELAVHAFQSENGCEADGIAGPETFAALRKALDKTTPVTASTVEIVGGNCYVRDGASTEGKKLGVAHRGESWPYAGETAENGWNRIDWNGKPGWVSGKYSRLVEGGK